MIQQKGGDGNSWSKNNNEGSIRLALLLDELCGTCVRRPVVSDSL